MNSRHVAIQPARKTWRSTLQAWSQYITQLLDDGKQKASIRVLDGVRAIACLSVLFFHINVAARDFHIWSPIHEFGSLVGAAAFYGQSGVVLFFILSGFLLFLPYAKAMLFDSSWPSFWQFYLRRIFRIVPAYFVALFLLIILFNQQYLQIVHWHELWLFLTFRQDFPITYQKIDGPFWTLAVEFQFYLLLPLIAWVMGLVVRRGKTRWRICKLTLCLLVMMAWGLLSLYWGDVWSVKGTFNAFISPSIASAIKPYIYGGSGKSLEVFAVGMLICMVYTYLQNTPQDSYWNKKIRGLSVSLFLVGLAFLSFMTLWHFYMWYFNYTLHFFDPYRGLLVHSWDEWQGILYAISFGLCMFALLYAPAWLKRPFEWPVMRWIGLISFSLYMWHDPLIAFFMKSVIVPLSSLHHSGLMRLAFYSLLWFWVLLLIIPVSLASYLFIEKPGIRFGENLRRKLVNVLEKRHVRPRFVTAPEKPLATSTQETEPIPK